MPVHLAVMVFQPSRDTYHGTYSSEAPSRLPQFFSSKHLAFLDLPTEFHDQILQASSDAAKRGKYYDARTWIGDNKTGLPQVASVLLACRRCYLTGKPISV